MKTSLIALSVALAGCSLTGLSDRDPGIAINECSDDVRCPEDQQCMNLRCVANVGTLSTLLFEVAPGISAGALAGAQLFQLGDKVPLVPDRYSISLNDVVTVSGFVGVGAAADCGLTFIGDDGEQLQQGPDGSIPVRMTFSQVQRMWGLAAPSIQAGALQAVNGYSFKASMAGGAYDVYVEPFAVLPQAASLPKNCIITPQLFRGQDLGRSTSLKLSVPTPKRLDMTVRFAEGAQNLDGWHADMIEPVTGRVVSSNVELKLPTRADGSLVYTFSVDYVPVWGDDPLITNGELLRLSPPSGFDAPTLYFWREGLEWASPGAGSVDRLGPFPEPVSFSGTVAGATPTGTEKGVPANVTFTAKEVASVSRGFFPSFIRSVKTDDQGRFKLDLLPGTYKVIATPLAPSDASRPFAVTTSTLTVLATSKEQEGTTLSVAPALDIQGVVRTPSGNPARGAAISAEVSPSLVDASVFQRAIGDLPASPRTSSATVDESGAFRLFAEPDVYDLSVRPPASAGFAWLVIPGFAPTATSGPDSPSVLPTDLYLPPPVPLELHLSLPTRGNAMTLLAGAAVRAYALLDKDGSVTTDPKAAVSAVRVAEGMVDSALTATLLLPAKLDRPPAGFSVPTDASP